MNLIKLLPSFIANQIAAGEVIERPASVVKELLENALDAGASHIAVEVSFGGLNKIKVSDNGSGILAEDLALAIAPHATSKISTLEDLHALKTMGFRGEALASIASVSKLIIRSRPATQEHGMQLLSLGPDRMEILPCSRGLGTTLEVADLFYNTPVRKKFLKSERHEYLAIDALMKRLAMSASHVGFTLSHNGRQQWVLNPAVDDKSYHLRIQQLLGKKFIETAIRIEIEQAGIALHGWLGSPAYQRNQNDGYWLYLNHRFIKDKLLHHAIKQAYEPWRQPGRYPVCLLYLTVKPEDVDVNVHPTKHEVRFHDPRLIHDFLVVHIQKALRSAIAIQANLEDVVLKPNPLLADRPTQVCEAPLNEYHYQAAYLPILSCFSGEILRIADRWFIMKLDEQVYLAHAEPLYYEYWLDYLSSLARPWPSRPLLVPLLWPDPMAKITPTLQSLLMSLGIALNREPQQASVSVSTLPLCVPQLPLQAFLSALLEWTNPDISRAIAILARQLATSAYPGSPEEEQEFLRYWSTRQTQLQQTGAVKALTPQWCQTLFNE